MTANRCWQLPRSGLSLFPRTMASTWPAGPSTSTSPANPKRMDTLSMLTVSCFIQFCIFCCNMYWPFNPPCHIFNLINIVLDADFSNCSTMLDTIIVGSLSHPVVVLGYDPKWRGSRQVMRQVISCTYHTHTLSTPFQHWKNKVDINVVWFSNLKNKCGLTCTPFSKWLIASLFNQNDLNVVCTHKCGLFSANIITIFTIQFQVYRSNFDAPMLLQCMLRSGFGSFYNKC